MSTHSLEPEMKPKLRKAKYNHSEDRNRKGMILKGN